MTVRIDIKQTRTVESDDTYQVATEVVYVEGIDSSIFIHNTETDAFEYVAYPYDMEAYPGSILVNTPKFKVHDIALLTNVVKNLGIGLYPMQAAHAGGSKWDYSSPHDSVPAMKERIPHQVWVSEMDRDTGPDVSRISVDSLFAAQTQVLITDFLYGHGQGMGSGQRVGAREGRIAYENPLIRAHGNRLSREVRRL